MNMIAFKMLIGDKSKFLGLVFGIFLSSFLICQQTSIFLGLVERTYRLMTDIPTPEIWVMDPGTENVDKINEMSDSRLDQVRSVPGVLWASPMSMAFVSIKLPTGLFHRAQVVAIDENTLIGAPQHMVKGNIEGLRRGDGVIVDQYAINHDLVDYTPRRESISLKLGDHFEIADHRVNIVGIAKLTLGFYPQPIVYMGYQQYKKIMSLKRRSLGFVLVRLRPNENVDEVVKRIKAETGLSAYSRKDFQWVSVLYFLKSGILMNFGTTVLSGFVLGIAIVGIMFYMLTTDYLPYFAMIRAIGGTPKTISKMIYFQALISGLIGFGLGVGGAALAGQAISIFDGTLAFLFHPAVFGLAAMNVILVCLFSAKLCIFRVLKQDPKLVMLHG